MKDDGFVLEEFDWIAENVFAPIYPLDARVALDAYGNSQGRCLDLGCGGGHFGLNVAKASEMTVTFLDVLPECVDRALSRAREWGMASRANGVVSDVLDMSFPNGSFDLIVSRGSIGFWGGREEVAEALRKAWDALAPGGCTYIGGGCGNAEVSAEIFKQMREINPDFPDNVRRKTNGLEAGDYMEIVSRFAPGSRVIDDDTGTWIIMRRA